MSCAPGFIVKNGSVVGYFLFNATVGTALSAIYSTRDELWEKFEQDSADRTWNKCTCQQAPEEVFLCEGWDPETSDYWPAQVCLHCRAIVGVNTPYEELPDGTEWPKRGLPPGITAEAIETRTSS